MGKLKQGVCVAESDCLLFRATRADCIVENDCAAPARSRVTDSSGSRAERAQPMKESRKRSFPRPRGGQDAFRGKILREVRISPRRFCVKGTGRVPPPRNASPAFGRLRRPPAALRAAPRAGASPVLQTPPRGTAPPRHRNILRNTLSSGVFHMNLPSQPPQIQRSLASHPAKGYLVNHHSTKIPPPPPGEVPRFARRRGVRPARGKYKHFKRNNLRAPDTMIHPPSGSRGRYPLNPACLAPRATPAETFVPQPARAEPCNAPRYKPRACAFPRALKQ